MSLSWVNLSERVPGLINPLIFNISGCRKNFWEQCGHLYPLLHTAVCFTHQLQLCNAIIRYVWRKSDLFGWPRGQRTNRILPSPMNTNSGLRGQAAGGSKIKLHKYIILLGKYMKRIRSNKICNSQTFVFPMSKNKGRGKNCRHLLPCTDCHYVVRLARFV